MVCRVLILSLLVAVFGCQHPAPRRFHNVVLDGHLEIRLPVGMWPQQDMHPIAGGQYADSEHGHYLLLLFDPLARVRSLKLSLNLASYHHYLCESVISGTDTGQIDTVRWVFAGKWKGIESIIEARPDTSQTDMVIWRVSSFLGSRGYYHLIQWFTKGYHIKEQQVSDSITFNIREREEGTP